MIPRFNSKSDSHWLPSVLQALRYVGCAVVEDVLDPDLQRSTREALYRVRDAIHRDIGQERLTRAGELGVLRLMMLYDEHFFKLLALPEVLAVVDATVSPTAILHLQNGFILPPFPRSKTPSVFQNQFHQDFRRVLNGYLMSVNTFIAISEFRSQSGATLLVPGTHQRSEAPNAGYLTMHAEAAECAAGSMVVFDSTLWHAAGENVADFDRLAINQQFTRSYLKQQIDYSRALGEQRVATLSSRVQQLLGLYSRVPASLDEYYRPPEERLYRAGQG